MPQREVPAIVTDRLVAWRYYFRLWRLVHYSFGLTATICSVRVAAHKSLPEAVSISLLSLVAAVCTALLTFLNAGSKSRAYTQAWRLVDGECMQFQVDNKYGEATLVEAVKKGEALIAKSDI